MLGEMHRQLLPCRERLSAESAGLVVRHVACLLVALLDLLPRWIQASSTLDGGLGFHLGLWVLVLTNKVLKEIVPAVADVTTILNIAIPPFEVAMPLILVANPICLSLEDLGISASIPSAGEGLNIFMNVLR